jgi:hypothetical protein
VKASFGWRRTGVWVLALCGASGCTRISDEHRFEPNPDEISILATVPEQDASGVSQNVQVDLCLSGLVDPRTVSDFDAQLSSGPQLFDSDLSVQLVPWRGPGGDPVPSNSEAAWCSGSVLSVTPAAALVGGVLYRVRLIESVSGWAGEALDTDDPGWTLDDDGELEFILEFTVAGADDTTGGGTDGDPIPPDDPTPAPTLTELFAEGSVLDPQRGLCSCHLDPNQLAHERLDLSTPQSAFAGLVVPTRSRDTGFPMVTPRGPSDSFLIHKLLRDRDGAAIHGVLGDPMPPTGPLPYADFVSIARWIESGAEP